MSAQSHINNELETEDFTATDETASDAGTHTEQLKILEETVADYKDKLLRAIAESENIRRRGEREREETAKFAVGKFAADMLTVADNLTLALQAVPANLRSEDELVNRLFVGVEATAQSLIQTLERYGIKALQPLGKMFDANLHEVMMEMESATHPAGTIIQVYQEGYMIAERLLRPARVVVAKAIKDDKKVDQIV
ncbi:MAG: nucleotide exchange factor GrpE [Alphaproteobacteria bacterium]